MPVYWKTCLAHQDGSCFPCFNLEPFNAAYSGPGFPLNTSMCPWKCANGFQLIVEKECKACPQGKFKGPTQSSCTTCPPFSTTLLEGEKLCHNILRDTIFLVFQKVACNLQAMLSIAHISSIFKLYGWVLFFRCLQM